MNLKKAYLMTNEEYLSEVVPVLKAFKDFLKKNKYFISLNYGNLPTISYPELVEYMNRKQNIGGFDFESEWRGVLPSYQEYERLMKKYNVKSGWELSDLMTKEEKDFVAELSKKEEEQIGKEELNKYSYDSREERLRRVWNSKSKYDVDVKLDAPQKAIDQKNEFVEKLRAYFGDKIFNSSIMKEADNLKSNKRVIRFAIDYDIYKDVLESGEVSIDELKKIVESAGVKIPKKLIDANINKREDLYAAIYANMPSINRDILTKLVESMQESFKPLADAIYAKEIARYTAIINEYVKDTSGIKYSDIHETIDFANKVFNYGREEQRPSTYIDRYNREVKTTVTYVHDITLKQEWEEVMHAYVKNYVERLKAQLIHTIVTTFEKITLPIKSFEQIDLRVGPKGFEGTYRFLFKNGGSFDIHTQAIYAGGYNIQVLHFRYLTDYLNVVLADGTRLANPSLAELILNFSDVYETEKITNPYLLVESAENLLQVITALYNFAKTKGALSNVRKYDGKDDVSLSFKVEYNYNKNKRKFNHGIYLKRDVDLRTNKNKAIEFLDENNAPQPTAPVPPQPLITPDSTEDTSVMDVPQLQDGGDVSMEDKKKAVVDKIAMLTVQMESAGTKKEKDAIQQQIFAEMLSVMTPETLNKLKEEVYDAMEQSILDAEADFVKLLHEITALDTELRELNEKEKTLPYGDEKRLNNERRGVIRSEKEKLDMLIINQRNVVKALRSGGDLSSFEDKKEFKYSGIPDFRKVKTSIIAFDEDTILTQIVPDYIPFIDENIFRFKGYLFDAIRIEPDTYLVAANGNTAFGQRLQGASQEITPDTYKTCGYLLMTLDQLVLTNEYYFVKAKAKEIEKAQLADEANEKYYDSVPESRRASILNQKNYYTVLPAAIKKKVTQAEYEAMTLSQKEELYKPFKRSSVKRLTSKLEEDAMWISYHKMYERFINPAAVMPSARVANHEVFEYWRVFRDMMKWKILDIRVQRESESDIRKLALETSFGFSNTNDSLKDEFGILVKRQNGEAINAIEIEQIKDAWEMAEDTFGTLSNNAYKDNLKISHTGTRYVFSSKAAGMYLANIKTIAASEKSGPTQFQCTMAHEIAHWIDNTLGGLYGKRYMTDDYESTAGRLAFEFRNGINKKTDSEYINATKECFARAMEQYFAIQNFGDEAMIVFSRTPLSAPRPYFAEDDYVSKEHYYNVIKPLVEKFLKENRNFFRYYTAPPIQDETSGIKMASGGEIKYVKGEGVKQEKNPVPLDDLDNYTVFYRVKEDGNFFFTKNQFWVWLYDIPNPVSKLKNDEFDWVFFPMQRNTFAAALEKGYIPPLLRVWTKKYQKETRGANHLVAVIEGYFNEEKGKIYVNMMTVKPEYRRQGITSALITDLRKSLNVSKENVIFHDKTKEGEMFEKSGKFEDGGQVNDLGGNYRLDNSFGSFTTITVMPIDENLRISKDYFSVKAEVRAKNEDGTYRLQIKPLKTYPIAKYDAFMSDLLIRGAKKMEAGGEVENTDSISDEEIKAINKATKKGKGVSVYQERVNTNLRHMGTESQDWKAVPIVNFQETTNDRDEQVSMPTFDFSVAKGFSKPETLFPAPMSATDAWTCCELCGKDIKNVYWIYDDKHRFILQVGSECVTYFHEGKSGKDNERDTKIMLAKMLDKDIINFRKLLIDNMSKINPMTKKREYEALSLGYYLDEAKSTEGFEKRVHDNLQGITYDSLKPKKLFEYYKTIHIKDILSYLQPFSYEREIEDRKRTERVVDMTKVDTDLLKWFGRSADKCVTIIKETMLLLNAMEYKFQNDYVSDYIESKNTTMVTLQYGQGGEISDDEESDESALEMLKRYARSVKNFDMFINFIRTSSTEEQYGIMQELNLPDSKTKEAYDANMKVLKKFYNAERAKLNEERKKRHEEVLAFIAEDNKVKAERNVDNIMALALAQSEEYDSKVEDYFRNKDKNTDIGSIENNAIFEDNNSSSPMKVPVTEIGGLAKGMSLLDIAHKHNVSVAYLRPEFDKGIKVEMEHTNDKAVAERIALDHLFEDMKYYTMLEQIEGSRKKIEIPAEFKEFGGNVEEDNTPRVKLNEATFKKLYIGVYSFGDVDRIMRTFLNIEDIERQEVYTDIYNAIWEKFWSKKPSIEEIKYFIETSPEIYEALALAKEPLPTFEIKVGEDQQRTLLFKHPVNVKYLGQHGEIYSVYHNLSTGQFLTDFHSKEIVPSGLKSMTRAIDISDWRIEIEKSPETVDAIATYKGYENYYGK